MFLGTSSSLMLMASSIILVVLVAGMAYFVLTKIVKMKLQCPDITCVLCWNLKKGMTRSVARIP